MATPKKLIDNKKYPFTIRKGQKIKIISSTHSHNYGPIGTICTVDINHIFNTASSGICGLVRGKNTINASQFILVSNDKKIIEEEIAILKQELIDKTNSIKKEIAELQTKLKFIQDNKLDNFDETQFKTYKVLQLLKNRKLSDIERAKLIASLVNE